MSIDYERVRQEIAIRAEVALRTAAEFTLGRAKHHAPVRAVFKRTRRGKAFTSKGPISTRASYRKFLKSKERRGRVDISEAPPGAEKLVSFGSSQQTGGITTPGRTSSIIDVGRPRQRTRSGEGTKGDLVAPDIGRAQRRLGRKTSFSGHANSLVPVFRGGDGFNTTGDLRRIGRAGPGLQQHRRRPDRVDIVSGNKVRQKNISSRGRYEFKQAKRNAGRQGRTLSGEKFTLPAAFNGRVGGRLRGEIRLTPVRWSGSTMWIYVEAPTPYASYQEFGTSRHRAQPFLRPALYESRKVLRSEVQKVADGVTITRGASSGVTPGRPGPGVE